MLFPVTVFQSFTELSAPPVQRVRPSGLIARHSTARSCASKELSMEPSPAFQTFTRLSVLPENICLPSDETAKHVTAESWARMFWVCLPALSQIRSVLSAPPETTWGSCVCWAAEDSMANIAHAKAAIDPSGAPHSAT